MKIERAVAGGTVETRPRASSARAPDTPRHRALASRSRAALFDLVLSADGGMTAAEAASASGLHPNTVRTHLDQLVGADLLRRERDRAGSPGRPAWRYRVAGSPEPTGGGLYRDLAATLVSHLARAADDPAAAGEQAGRDWGRRLASGTDPGARSRAPAGADSPVDGVAGVLGRLGFTPVVVRRDTGGGGVVHLRTCPFLDLVDANRDVVCGLHLGVVRGALGGLGASTAGTALEPFAAGGACVVRVGGAAVRTGER